MKIIYLNMIHQVHFIMIYVFYNTEFKTDIILKDRRNEIINNNMSLCENNCEYKERI